MNRVLQAIFVSLFLTTLAAAEATPADMIRRLNAPQPRVRFDQAALSDALAITGETVHINAIADWAALQQQNISQNTLVSMDFNNASAATTLDVLCRLIGGGAEWKLQDGVVHISTQDELDKQGIVKAYWPNGIGGIPADRATKAANILRFYVSGLDDNSIRISDGQLMIRGDADTQQRVARVLALFSRPMTPAEWREMLGVEVELNDSRQLLNISWESFPLGRCLNDLSTRINLPIVLDRLSNADQPITLELKNATPREVLDGLLAAAGGNGASSQANPWTSEPAAQGKVLWVGPANRASNWCACYLLGPATMRQLRINSPMEGPAAICSAVGGCDGSHILWIGGDRILSLQKMDQILAIGKVLADPSFVSAMRPARADESAAASGR